MNKDDYITGQTLLVDKPAGWTSFDVVNKLRYSLRKITDVKKIKVGHAGTLDPFATGLLIICTGKLTKTIDSITGQEKEYIAEFELGKSTDSQDVTGEITEEKMIPPDLTKETIQTIISEHFLGNIEQLPPMHSAIKVDGVRLYKHAHKGKTVERKTRIVSILNYELLDYSAPLLSVRIKCSKGTYIRTLAYDLGVKLGTVAYCKQLRRTKIGNFSVSEALSVDQMNLQIRSLDPSLFELP
jgi:tRNA pseudouridine55 synthase